MSPSTMTIPHKMRWPIALIILGAVAVAFFVSASLVAGYGLNLRGFGRMLLNTTLAAVNSGSVTRHSTGEYRNIVFLHQSVGANLIEKVACARSSRRPATRFGIKATTTINCAIHLATRPVTPIMFPKTTPIPMACLQSSPSQSLVCH